MGWTETHRRWQVLRDLEAELTRDPMLQELPWREEYADLFGDRETLMAMMRYRWKLTREAQLDSHLPEDVLALHERRLERRFAGVRRLLETRAGSGSADVAA